ncbi:MAG: hypothetical protein ABI364_03635, partial [Caldimonas sp.]
IGKSGVASAFGAAGSLVLVFVWVYYSAQIFLVGAEFTWVYARTLGSLRGLDGAAEIAKKAVAADAAPTRSDSAAPAMPPKAVSAAARSAMAIAHAAGGVAEAPTAPAQVPAQVTPSDYALAGGSASVKTPAPRARSSLRDLGAGVAFYVALRYVVPRLLRRL